MGVRALYEECAVRRGGRRCVGDQIMADNSAEENDMGPMRVMKRWGRDCAWPLRG